MKVSLVMEVCPAKKKKNTGSLARDKDEKKGAKNTTAPDSL